ncbi:dinucleotide-utilizing protein [Algoriphagus kandeliae]|uniref:Molybdopterin-synthase adenylyltransferase n=1 Tax=Algoriphagus kandeliae TaxID=2562278 RepID=A0A4Y9QNN7_9BACT|nr:HesA/MoeB/ThiF family protein [Algoriphagus kandeliae]TFV94261.1 dinucleotide-utilizing protein [Algoriphagus kandeliae]
MSDRFERQRLVPDFGIDGQEKLRNSSVLVIGAGGLGSPILLYLAAMGVGHIGIVDGDQVSISNLNRQVLYGVQDVGKNKAEVAANFLRAQYPDCSFTEILSFISVENVVELIEPYDLVIDGSDNFPTRYLVNDACVLLKKPLVFGAIYQHEGQVSVFNLGIDSCNYRDIFPNPPKADEVPNCSVTGVIGVLPGVIGNLMAMEAVKVLADFGSPLKNRVLFYQAKSASFYEIKISPNPSAYSLMPKNLEELSKTDYELVCEGLPEISWEEIPSQIPSNVLLVDLREPDELPKLENWSPALIPFSQLEENFDLINKRDLIYFFCQSGVRSLKAVRLWQKDFPQKSVFSIRGGMKAMLKN